MFKTFDEAKAAVQEHAQRFIGEKMLKIVTEDFGGSESDDFVCVEMELLAQASTPCSTLTFNYRDAEEGNGSIEVRCYDHEGGKFCIEYLDEGGPSETGSICYVTEKTYYEIAA